LYESAGYSQGGRHSVSSKVKSSPLVMAARASDLDVNKSLQGRRQRGLRCLVCRRCVVVRKCRVLTRRAALGVVEGKELPAGYGGKSERSGCEVRACKDADSADCAAWSAGGVLLYESAGYSQGGRHTVSSKVKSSLLIMSASASL